MKALHNIKSPITCIPCIFNSGRTATIRVNPAEPEKVHVSIETESGRPYQMVLDSYLHIDKDRLESYAKYENVNEIKSTIDMINKYFFAGKLQVFSDDKEIVDRFIAKTRSTREFIKDVYLAFTDVENSFFRRSLGAELSLKDRFKNALEAMQPQKERIEVVQKISSLHLGGSWQNYSEKGWIKEAEVISQSKICLA